MERTAVGENRRGDEPRADRTVEISREQSLPLDSRGHPRFGFFGRFRNGARSPRQHDLRRAAARGRYADALCRATPGAYRTGIVHAGRHSATVFRRGPRQGADAGRHSFRHFFHNESVHRFHLCQRLQYVQPHLPGLYSGRGALPRLSGQPEPFLRTRLERNDDSCHIARNDRLHHRTRHDQTLQHVQLGHRHGRGGPRVQFGSGHEGIGGSRPRTPSSVGRGGMERSLLSGETRRRENRFRTGAGFPVRFSVPCRTVRELVDSGSRPAFAAGSRYRGLHGHLAVRPRE